MNNKRNRLFYVIAVYSLFLLPFAAEAQETNRVSISSDGTEGNGNSYRPYISLDGRFVSFVSKADNLVENDTNGVADIFVHDRNTGKTERISVSSTGTEGNGSSLRVSISSDGQYVVFESNASNLVENDTNGASDIFVHDRSTGQTTRISISPNGTEGNADSRIPFISGDGRYVVFYSNADNLVSNDSNGLFDIFLHDRNTDETTRISVASDGTEANNFSFRPRISPNGRYIVYYSYADNLVPGDTNGVSDVFLYDTSLKTTSLISKDSNGNIGNNNSDLATVSSSGRYVAFISEATNLVEDDNNDLWDTFVHDRETGITTRISLASDGSEANDGDSGWFAFITPGGRYVAFASEASLVENDTNGFKDTFVHDRLTGTTSRVSIGSNGEQGVGGESTWYFSMSGNGRFVAFASSANNLIPNDNNDTEDVFIHDYLGVTPGDINNDEYIDLTDAVIALKICSDMEIPDTIHQKADINADNRIGIEEAVNALQTASEIKTNY